MDHLAPTPGVNWYSYSPIGEWLGGSQLPPMELEGLDVGRPLASQAQYMGNSQVPTVTSDVSYIQDNHNLTIVEDVHYIQPSGAMSPSIKTKDVSKVRSALGEKISCLECGATFACSANLRNHLRIHTGERPFICEECGASFTQRSNLRSHKRVHTGERPYMCGICGQTFARSSHLPGHMRTHTGEKPFDCPHCGRSFATNQIMKNHLRTHTGERPFVCEVCDATFAQSSCLATHKKIHTGERNFICEKCGKAFISRSGLQTHERVHTGEKPYTCEKCDKSFKTSSYLSKHKQKYCGNNGYKVKTERAKKPEKKSSARKLEKSMENAKSSVRVPKKFASKRLRHSRRLMVAEVEEEWVNNPNIHDADKDLMKVSAGLKGLIVKQEEMDLHDSNQEGSNAEKFVIDQHCHMQENEDPVSYESSEEEYHHRSSPPEDFCHDIGGYGNDQYLGCEPSSQGSPVNHHMSIDRGQVIDILPEEFLGASQCNSEDQITTVSQVLPDNIQVLTAEEGHHPQLLYMQKSEEISWY